MFCYETTVLDLLTGIGFYSPKSLHCKCYNLYFAGSKTSRQ